MNEFELIKCYFDWGMGIGDDCAVIDVDENFQWVSTVDTLIENVHFPKNTTAADIAYKALAVNLSDLAAMGAMPKHFTLALTLPTIDKKWLHDFSTTLKALANEHHILLVGGDTTRGRLSITINATGVVKKGRALLRSNAQVGDVIFVSGNLGGATLALAQLLNQQKPNHQALKKLNRPTPKVELGLQISNFANACIDISDGLSQDLSHILQASNVGGEIWSDKLPIFKKASLDDVLYGGDDYQLCWTATPSAVMPMENVTHIGTIVKEKGLRMDGKLLQLKAYQHFETSV